MPSLDLARALALGHGGGQIGALSHLGVERWRRAPPAPVAGLKMLTRTVTTVTPWIGGGTDGTFDMTSLNLKAGDMVVMIILNASNTTRVPSMPEGWEKYGPHVLANSTQDSNIDVFYKVMGATPDETFLLASGLSGTSVFHFYVFEGFDPVAPFSGFAAHTATNTRISNPPAITPERPNSVIIGAAMAGYTSAQGIYDIEVLGQSALIANRDDGTCASTASWCLPWASGTYDQPAISTPGSTAGNSGAAIVFAVNPAG